MFLLDEEATPWRGGGQNGSAIGHWRCDLGAAQLCVGVATIAGSTQGSLSCEAVCGPFSLAFSLGDAVLSVQLGEASERQRKRELESK